MGKNNRVVMKRMLHNPMAVMGMVIFLIIVFCAIFGPWIAPYDISKVSVKEAFQSPSARHLFGTDNLGRDIFSRLLVGAKYSLMIGLGAEVIALFGGLVVGSIAGFFGQRVDDVIMRLCDVIQSIPGMVLNIALAAVLGLGIVPCFLALGIGGIAGNARMIRANILKIRKNEFVDAASSINCSTPRIIIRHVLPNTISPMIVSATMDMARSIMAASSLSYLGLGVQPPNPEWGAMLSAGKSYILNYPYMCLAPGIVIAITVLSLNLMGDGLRDALDPKLKK
ncbi:MAG: ABC transporter permease [Hungatella hathewayi]|nr:ABC transporter permease [Hungatella hathewayi]MBS4986656.1 ABC transporter permease [Hungatella hathewayi]